MNYKSNDMKEVKLESILILYLLLSMSGCSSFILISILVSVIFHIFNFTEVPKNFKEIIELTYIPNIVQCLIKAAKKL